MPPFRRLLTLVCLLALLAPVRLIAQSDARAALQKAATLVQQGRFDDADRQLQPALADPHTRAAAYSVLGAIRFRQKRLDESVTLLQKSIELEPRLVGAHLSLAQVYIAQGKLALATSMLEKVLELDPSNGMASLALAQREAAKGNYQKSWDLAQPARAQLMASPDGLILLAADALKLKKQTEFAAMAAEWKGLPNVSQVASIRFGVLLLGGGAVADGIAVLEHARDTTPPSFELAFNLGSAYLMSGNPEKALESYDQALAIKPDSVPALQQAALTAERRSAFERSLSYWVRLRKIQPDDPATLLGFGRVCLKMDLLDDAEPALTKAATAKPDDPTYQYILAAAKVGKRQFEDAQHLLEGLISQHPGDAQLEYALGSVLYLQGRLPDAAEHLRTSLRIKPEQLASSYYLALVTRDQGRDADAIEMLDAIVKQHADHVGSCEALGELLMGAKRYPEAEVQLRNAVRLDPRSVKANYQLGLLLARTGRKAEADKLLEAAKTLRTEDEANSRLQLRLLDANP